MMVTSGGSVVSADQRVVATRVPEVNVYALPASIRHRAITRRSPNIRDAGFGDAFLGKSSVC
jgi:hypothetical protein